MAADIEIIRRALRVRLEAVTGLPEVQWEGRAFNAPANNAMYIRETLVPADAAQVATKQVQTRGYYQLDVFFKKGTGTEKPGAVAQLLRTLFNPTLILQSSQGSIYIERTVPGRINDFDSDMSMIPTFVYWRVYTPAA